MYKKKCNIMLLILSLNALISSDIALVSAGAGHSLLLKTDGTVYSWGANNYGQLGTGDTDECYWPTQVRNPTGFGYLNNIIDISAGNGFSLALTSDSIAYAWGVNNYGQLGNGTTVQSSLPVRITDSTGSSFLDRIRTISAGSFGALALDSDGYVWSWGSNREGALGIGSSDFDPHPLPQHVLIDGGDFLDNVTKIICGSLFNLAQRADSSIWAWGANGDGQLGNDTTLSSYFANPVLDSTGIASLGGVVAIAATGTGVFGIMGHSLALDSEGKFWSWGRNFNGQLGDATFVCRDLPTRVRNSYGGGFFGNAISISAGSEHSLALCEDGSVWAWGNNYYGVIGNNTTSDRNLPTQVHGVDNIGYLTDIVQISTSNSHNFAIDSEGNLYGWGRNNSGQIGDGTVIQRNYPVAITSIPVGLQESIQLPAEIRLWVYPNPFNSAVTIAIDGVGGGSRVPFDVEIFDVNGRMVDEMTVGATRRVARSTGQPPVDPYEYVWQPDESLPSGVYLVRARVETGSISGATATSTKRIVYLK
jgi:alpha-tubulin suppressor-like RCC1 family protein